MQQHARARVHHRLSSRTAYHPREVSNEEKCSSAFRGSPWMKLRLAPSRFTFLPIFGLSLKLLSRSLFLYSISLSAFHSYQAKNGCSILQFYRLVMANEIVPRCTILATICLHISQAKNEPALQHIRVESCTCMPSFHFVSSTFFIYLQRCICVNPEKFRSL